jgi:hypothetical protein
MVFGVAAVVVVEETVAALVFTSLVVEIMAVLLPLLVFPKIGGGLSAREA